MKITKYLLPTFFFLLTVLCVEGQIIKSVGFKSGLTMANQTWIVKTIDTTFKKDYGMGFYFVGTMDFLNSKYFNITADIGYIEKANNEKIENTSNNMPEGDGTYKTYYTKFNNFLFSPLLKVKFENKHWIPYALLGFRFDYQLSYKSDFNNQGFYSEFNKTIWGLTPGAGIEYKLNNLGISTEFQYHYDLTKQFDNPSSPTNAGLEINNQAFIVSMGVKYYLKK